MEIVLILIEKQNGAASFEGGGLSIVSHTIYK